MIASPILFMVTVFNTHVIPLEIADLHLSFSGAQQEISTGIGQLGMPIIETQSNTSLSLSEITTQIPNTHDDS